LTRKRRIDSSGRDLNENRAKSPAQNHAIHRKPGFGPGKSISFVGVGSGIHGAKIKADEKFAASEGL
jgi:hypothetical protein